jgi:hypothetical protein
MLEFLLCSPNLWLVHRRLYACRRRVLLLGPRIYVSRGCSVATAPPPPRAELVLNLCLNLQTIIII